MKLDIVWQGPACLGEGPLWHPAEKALYFIDIKKKTLERLDPATQAHQVWRMPDYIGSVVARQKGGLLATVGQFVVAIEMPSGKLTKLAKVIPDNRPDLRMNDGKVDRAGRFWIGVANLDTQNPQGGLFRFDPDGTLTQMESGITISNGLGWSPDNKTFYYTDSLKHQLYAYDFDLASGSLSNRRVLVQLTEKQGEPDGLTVDSQGAIWQAHWEGAKVVCYSQQGVQQHEIPLPVKRPTSCIFGGEAFETLYITSCSESLVENTALPNPAGAIFAIKVGAKGMPEPYFAG